MKRRGFTLIELIVVITIVGIIAGVVGFVLFGAVDAWTFRFKRAGLLSDGRLAINRMVREIREVKDLTSVITANTSQFRFKDTDDTDITYSLNGSDLDRTEDAATNTLAENVSTLSFTYYDSNGSAISTPVVSPSATDIRRVLIDLTLTKDGEDVYLESESVPRNF